MSAGRGAGEAIAELASKAAGSVAGKEVGAEVSSVWRRTFSSEDNFFFGKNATPEHKLAGQLIQDTKRVEKQIVPQLQAAPGAAPPGGALGQAMQLRGYSKDMARDRVWGKNFKAGATLMAISHVKNGPAATANLMDHIALALREDEEIPAKRFPDRDTGEMVTIPGQKRVSEFKRASYKAIMNLPQFKSGAPIPKEYEGLSPMSPYEKPSPLERWTTNFVYSRLSPLIAIPHLGTALNIVLATKTSSWLPALIDHITNSTPQQIRDTLLHGGVVTESILRDLDNRAAAENGKILSKLPGSFQDIYARISSTPFFPQIRNFQASWAGAASYHDAIDYAGMLGRNNFDKTAERRLELYGMRPNDIAAIKQTGQLTQDQLERAVYNGANRMIFFDTSFARTFNSQRNGYWRATHLYHGYISQQAKFMAEEWKMQVRNDTRTLGSIAKFGVVAGAAFPVFGEGIKILEMAARGQFMLIPHQLKEDYENITFQHGDTALEKAWHALGTYIDAYCHLGGLGIGYGLIQGAQRGALGMQEEGAIFGTIGKYFQDTVNVPLKGQFKPWIRDTLTYSTPWGIGRFAAHALFPTKTEEKEEHPSMRLKPLGRRKRGTGLKPLGRM